MGLTHRYHLVNLVTIGIAITYTQIHHFLVDPELVETPSDQTITEGNQITFHCQGVGNPAPEINWIKDGKHMGEGETLTVVALRNDSGLYWCVAENDLGDTANASASLDVQFPPSFTIVPSDQTVMEQERVTFTCSATGNPVPNITWIKDGNTMGVEDVLSFEARRDESGIYRRLADNGIEKSIETSFSFNVQYLPTLDAKPSNQTVTEGAKATFHCNATGNPAPSVRWIKDGKTVGNEDLLSFVTKRNDSGKYWCLAESDLNSTVTEIAHLDVQFGPELVETPLDETITEGNQITFRCRGVGNPAPEINWIKDGEHMGEGEVLTFDALRNDSGEYWCVAWNGFSDTANASAYLDVQYPSSFTSKPIDKTVKEGVDINFHCAVNGKPTPNVSWIKDGKIVGSGDMLTITAYKNLSGKYWCSAYNGLGERVNASANLNVQFKPKQTNLSVNVNILKPVPFGTSIEFSCTTHSHPHAKGFKFYRDEKLLDSNSTGIYNLRLERSGLYSCVPFNSAGEGKRATLRINVIAWQPSFKNLLFGPFYLFKGIQARLPCKPSAEPSPTIKWLKDEVVLRYVENGSYSLNSDGTLVINKVDNSDSGRYTCVAENYFGKASVTASGILLERTKLVRKPRNRTVAEGSSLKLRCMASKDPTLELRYIWKKDGAVIMDVSNSEWQEIGFVLTLSNIGYQDAGVYTCVAHTQEPRVSEDMASAVVSIEGTSFPPTNVQITDCSSNRTNISWTPNLSNGTQVTHYLIEQETNHEPFSFKVIYNVTNPNSTSLTLELPGWSTLRFRVRAVSNVKLSRPSEATAEGICITPVGVPQVYPMNLRGFAYKANELFIIWTPMSKTKWNAPGCYYMLKYREENLPGRDWRTEKIGDPSVRVFSVSDPGYYQPWEFKICAGNHQGLGPESPISRSFSGQDAPDVKPDGAGTQSVNATSVALAWQPVTLKTGSVDGYKIYYWVNSRSVISRRRREVIPANANLLVLEGGKRQKATLLGLKPYTFYQVVVKAFNTGGEGPASAVVLVRTSEGEPGPPSDLETYAFGEYILVTWKQPQVPNGIITNYQVKCQEYNGSVVKMANVQPSVFKKLLDDLAFEKSYELEVTAKTSKGWGESARTVAKTVMRSETEFSSLNPESCELECLHLNDGKLVWMNDLESLKKFVENVLKLQGKWLTPGGNTKQFKCSNGNVIINWYSKKQQTLNFQGRDGPALKDKLMELIHKKPRNIAETQDANSLSSTEQSSQPSTLLQETDSGESNFQTSTDGESLLNGSEKRPNSEIIADIEGLKLDLLILQKQVQENTKLLSMKNIQKQDGNALGVELLDYKKKCEKLLSTISKKDNAINELEEKCLFLESRVLSLEQENDSPKLALTIITREKSEVETNQLQSSDRWSVAKPHPRSTNAKHSQKTMPANIIQTRNGFEPLQVQIEDQIERNVSNQNGNSAVTGHRTSPSSSEIRMRNTNLINSSDQFDHSQPNRQKKVIIAGDSTLKYL
ncbi:contactin-2-like [Montipora capricornis]|uniref:contactin-2-like n=1 Tax=Montipora capricornis TaxID=246305 RepID=UPI0035F1AF0E